ncbi:MAG: substrate-binding domain-containing protein [Thermoplasmata archaeon]|nr:substrate-binding domain-containing protein [Thermoplasmata archaeon]
MDNKIYAIAAVVIILVAGVGAYFVLGGGNNSSSSSDPHAVTLDGVTASEENVSNGTYEISRNLVLVTLGEPTGNVAAFLSWITSAEGQAILAEEFVPLDSEDMTTEVAPSSSGQTSLVVGGSTSLTETMTKLVEAYTAKYSFMSISVQTGGSGVGESSAASGTFDIGMLSRDMSSKYEGTLVDHTIGHDGVAVVCNIEGVSNLTLEQVAKIFSGEYTNWSQVGGPDETIRVIIREDGSGTRECFENAMKTTDSSWTVTTNSQSCNSTGTVISNIKSTYGSIGYISIGKLSDLTGEDSTTGAHAVTLDGVIASEASVSNGTYEISRNLVLVTLGEPTGNTAAFLSWITSAEGQAILAEEFVPLDSDEMTTEIAPSSSGDTSLVVGGSTSLTETMTKLVEAYTAKYSFMSISVQTGGSGVGESSAASGTFDIGMLSRDMSSKYEGTLVDHTIGHDGVAVVCNIEGVSNLTLEQVAKIFSGEYTNWSQVGGPDETIRVIIREDGSGTRECFENAMKTTDSDWTVTVNAQSCNSTGTVISNVQSTYGSIGYISIGKLGDL